MPNDRQGHRSSRRLPEPGTVEIAASILSSDFGRLAQQIAAVEAGGVRILQLDVMDGHFVPNISFGPPVVSKIRKYTELVFDVHLMISEPARYAKAFVEAGADHITFHIEAVDKPMELVEYLHRLGVTAGVALNPETEVEAVAEIAPYCELVLVMTVEPGFGGQDFLLEAAAKCRPLRRMLGEKVRIQVDGGIVAETAPIAVSYGADTLVVGNGIYSADDPTQATKALIELVS